MNSLPPPGACNVEERAAEMNEMGQLVDEGIAILGGRVDITEFGKVLHRAWKVKRRFSSRVSSQRIDEIYERSRASGAIG